MKAAYLTQPHRIEMKDIRMPMPGIGEVLIRLNMVGICGSDVHLFQGHRDISYPIIPGHEAIGYIEVLGSDVSHLKIGDRVVIEPNIACTTCKYCLSGRGNICVNKRVIGLNQPGCFSEFVIVPSSHAWKLPDSIDDLNAVTIEPMAVALHAVSLAKAKPGDTIAVIGLGAIGLLVTHLAIALGYKVIVTELNKSKIKLATDLGATASPTGDSRKLAMNWDENNVAAVFECAGSENTVSLATATAPRGSEIILLGLSSGMATFQPLKIVREGISILPSIIYNHPADYVNTIELIQNGKIHPSFIISDSMSLSTLQTGLEKAALGNDSKIVITI